VKRIKRKRVNTGGAKIPGQPFMGEIMDCVNCHKKEKSDPKIQSNWTAIKMDNITIYVCPTCFGNGAFSEKTLTTKRV
jgi:hypothetical protein